jgi:hypothetical protein
MTMKILDDPLARSGAHRTRPRAASSLLTLGALSLLALPATSSSLAAQPTSTRGSTGPDLARTTLVILGVEHSAQLVGRSYHPGYLRAFFDRVHPAAICVERSPEEFARGDYYEFTYEVQHVAVPYARERGIDLCPIDWLPSRDDERLAFGRLEVVDPPAVRPSAGFQTFLTIDSLAARHTLFFADSDAARRVARAFFDGPRRPGTRDFPRRLDLYRTFLQAMRVQAAARAHPGRTVLVVVGAFHKDDLENILGGDPRIRVIQPSSYGAPRAAKADARLTPTDLAAIASFNLLGLQATTGVVDWPWVRSVLDDLERASGATPEVRLLRTRYAVIVERRPAADAALAYERIAQDADSTTRFTFTGVEDPRRVDSYYDPFGNLTVRQRAQLEAAREWVRAGRPEEVRRIGAEIRRSARWGPLAGAQFDAYWARYITPSS